MKEFITVWLVLSIIAQFVCNSGMPGPKPLWEKKAADYTMVNCIVSIAAAAVIFMFIGKS